MHFQLASHVVPHHERRVVCVMLLASKHMVPPGGALKVSFRVHPGPWRGGGVSPGGPGDAAEISQSM